MTYPIQPNMIPMRDIKQFSDGDRLFYELGIKLDPEGGYGDNWIKTGQFQEIENPKDFLWDDKLLSKVEYLEHHNFMLIKKNINMEKEFVIYALALRMKALGFDEPCLAWFVSEEHGLEFGAVVKSDLIKEGLLAPTWQSAFRWFRDKYKLKYSVDIDNSYRIFGGIWDVNGYKDCVYDIDSGAYNSHEESELECLKNIIEIVESELK